MVVSAATGRVRNGIAARDTIASIKRSLDGVIVFSLRAGTACRDKNVTIAIAGKKRVDIAESPDYYAVGVVGTGPQE